MHDGVCSQASTSQAVAVHNPSFYPFLSPWTTDLVDTSILCLHSADYRSLARLMRDLTFPQSSDAAWCCFYALERRFPILSRLTGSQSSLGS